MSEKPRRSLKRKILIWVIRAVCLSIMLAMLDCWSACYMRCTVFSITQFKLKDGGTTGSVGFGYFLTYYRELGGPLEGPVIWFWFSPVVIDAAHPGIRFHWIWALPNDA
ncbi:MAG: hypothetical protein JWQ04_2022 [Pedosphaera sp.]|nr:hypothetical protein [Pedosphaera sp.]